VLTYGTHALELMRRFGSPLFPFWNWLFSSPWSVATTQSTTDIPSGTLNILRAIASPVLWTTGPSVLSEAPLRDPRILLGFLAALFALFALRKGQSSDSSGDRALRALASFFLVSWVGWLAFFRIGRYALALEALGATLAVLAIVRLTRGWHKAGLPLLLATCTVAALVTVHPRWGRIPFSRQLVEAPALAIPPDSIVLLVERPHGTNQLTHLIPHLEPRACYVQAWSRLVSPDDGSLLSQRIRATLAQPKPKYVLHYRDRNLDTLATVLETYDLRIAQRLLEFTSNSSGEVIVFARLAPLDAAPLTGAPSLQRQ
jgi:hypothetical protein